MENLKIIGQLNELWERFKDCENDEQVISEFLNWISEKDMKFNDKSKGHIRIYLSREQKSKLAKATKNQAKTPNDIIQKLIEENL